MHLKNFSLIEDDPGSRVFGLSAAYDLLPVNIIMPQDMEQMALTVNGKKRNIRKKDFFILAEHLELSNQTVQKILVRLLKLKEKMIAEVNMSYLPEEMKEELVKLMEERSKVFA